MRNEHRLRVAVLKGGDSLERSVSLRSGSRVAQALRDANHLVFEIDAGPTLVAELEEAGPDVVFIALHGRGGEDGTVQEMLEIMELPYTGSNVLASMLSMDKAIAKMMMQDAGIPTPSFVAFNKQAFKDLGAGGLLARVDAQLGFPVVVKPARQGSALGIKFAAAPDDVPAALVNTFSYDDRVLLERYVQGRELAVSVLDGEALPIVEAIPNEGSFFDFESRYEVGKTRFVCPAELDTKLDAEVRQIAEATYGMLGCAGIARVDFMLPTDGRPQVLEVNSIPGLTETSLTPQAAEAAGISFENLVVQLIDLAVARATRRDR